MTITVTTCTDATALSGQDYPELALVEAEGYWWHLARLRESVTREQAAGHALALARAADHIGGVLAGTAGAVPDTARDPLAWMDLATYLTRLAQALHGGCLYPGGNRDASDGDHWEWEDLAAAATRREFAAAWYPIGENLRQLAEQNEDDQSPRLRAFTAAQTARAAAAIIDAPW
jgi:hypothetical protein